MDNSVKVIAILLARPGKAEELRALLETLIIPSRGEPGNLTYNLWCEQSNPSQYIIEEVYRSKEAADFHRQTAHYQNYFSKINDLAERKAMVLDRVNVV